MIHRLRKLIPIVLFSAILSLPFALPCESGTDILTPKQQLGKLIFFDENLSNPPGQSCANCHESKAGFAEPDRESPISEGAVKTRFGNRNAMTVAYAAFCPSLKYDPTMRPGIMEGMYVGGFFWDGRAASLEEQAKGPFINPLEMHGTKQQVVRKVRSSKYAAAFKAVFGPQAFTNVDKAYDYVAEAIADYERSSEVSLFNSKYDLYVAGKATLTDQEKRGLDLFSDTTTMGAKCVNCHSMSTDNPSGRALFTNFGYQNLGVPRNPNHPFYKMPGEFNPAGKDYVDLGLGEVLKDAKEDGKFKIPSLRNAALMAPYMHNGVFKTLKEVVHFDNTRDQLARCGQGLTSGKDCWDAPEVERNVHRHRHHAHRTLGQLELTAEQEDDIVAFLMTLTDDFKAERISDDD